MALQTRTIVDQRVSAVELVKAGITVSEVAERVGVSRQAIYNWLDRERTDPESGLHDRSRRPHTSPTRTAEAIEQRVIAERRQSSFGAKKILRRLQDEEPNEAWPPRSTIDAILKRAGMVHGRKTPRRRFAPVGAHRPYDACSPGEVMTADYKGQFRLRNGSYCYPLLVADPVSRYLLACDAYAGISLSVRLMKYGVQPVYSRPGRPGDNGRHERLNRTLVENTVINPAHDHAGQQILFDRFMRMYNEERPHESLGQDRPISRHRSSPRPFPAREPVIEYEPHFETRIVSRKGYINWQSERVFFSDAFAGELVGFERIDYQSWRVHYGTFQIGHFGTAERRLV
jgi:putative transposase